MATLPTQGGSSGSWGTQLDDWLLVSHNSDGTALGGLPFAAFYASAGGSLTSDPTAPALIQVFAA